MKKIKITKTVRYEIFGNPETAENLWVVLHGYGQLPQFFIRKFHSLDPEKNFVIAPEGFHRFYLKGTSGRVGASWMTKEARENDIADNINYLNKFTNLVDSDFDKRIILGFSQGGATAARWHELGNFSATHFILWASVFPPDLEIKFEESKFSGSENTFIVGRKDPYYNKEKIDTAIHQLEKLNFHAIQFDGVHDIDGEVLKKIL